MAIEIQSLIAFYTCPLGQAAARLVGQRLRLLWPSLAGLNLLGIGHVTPYLSLWRGEETRAFALRPAHFGQEIAIAAPDLIAAEDALPFPDLLFDRVLLIHGLELAENVRRLLREIWRVLRDDGRLLVVVPNRRGVWTLFEHTPFGHGQPYSPGQVERLLARHLFSVCRRDSALYTLPFRPFLLRAGAAWERCGRLLCPAGCAGVTIIEAKKEMLAAIPAEARRRRAALQPA